jgi:hypothetical protein
MIRQAESQSQGLQLNDTSPQFILLEDGRMGLGDKDSLKAKYILSTCSSSPLEDFKHGPRRSLDLLLPPPLC